MPTPDSPETTARLEAEGRAALVQMLVDGLARMTADEKLQILDRICPREVIEWYGRKNAIEAALQEAAERITLLRTPASELFAVDQIGQAAGLGPLGSERIARSYGLS
jgi:hypothetical protein